MIQKNNRLLFKNKKAQMVQNLSLLLTAGIIITIVIITLAIGGEVLQDGFITTPGNETLVDNISIDGQLGLGNLSGQVGLIGTVIALTVVLLILVTLLFRNFGGGV